MSFHKVLGICLGAFNPRSQLRRSKGENAGCPEQRKSSMKSSRPQQSSQLSPPFLKASEIPSTSGCSGPGTTKVTPFSWANLIIAGKSAAFSFTPSIFGSVEVLVPPLPLIGFKSGNQEQIKCEQPNKSSEERRTHLGPHKSSGPTATEPISKPRRVLDHRYRPGARPVAYPPFECVK